MIITDKFVFVHLPKTGGTFVGEMISKVYGSLIIGTLKEFETKQIYQRPAYCFRTRTKHVSRYRIPGVVSKLPVFTCSRDPFELYVSQFRFGTWRREPEYFDGIEKLENYPDISFQDFVVALNENLWRIPKDSPLRNSGLGWQTLRYLHFLSGKEPRLSGESNPKLSHEDFIRIVSPIHYLRIDHLAEDLTNSLLKLGYENERLAHIRDNPVVLPMGDRTPPGDNENESSDYGEEGVRLGGARRVRFTNAEPNRSWRYLYSESLMEYVYNKERLLFDIFPS